MSRGSGSSCHHSNSVFFLYVFLKITLYEGDHAGKKKVLSTSFPPPARCPSKFFCFFPLPLLARTADSCGRYHVYIFFYRWMTWTCLSVTNGGNQPIIILQSFKNVLPKPSVLFSLRTHRLSHRVSLFHPLPSSSKPHSDKVFNPSLERLPPPSPSETHPTHALLVFVAPRWDSGGKNKKNKTLCRVLVFRKVLIFWGGGIFV